MDKKQGLIVLSVFLALLIWLQITLRSQHRTVVNFPVVLVNLSPDVSLSKLPKTIPFDVRGNGIDLVKLYFSSAKVVIDASKLRAGEEKLPLDDYNLRELPSNCNIEIFGPAIDREMTVSTDVMLYKNVRVAPVFENEATRVKFNQLDYILNPSRIKIHGPRRELNNLKSISTAPINMSMLGKKEFYIPIALSSSRISSSVLRVHVSRLPKQIQAKVFEAIKIDSDSREIFPQTATIKVEGDPQIIKQLKSSDFQIKAAKEADKDKMLELEAVLPQGIIKYEITPRKVSLR
jgi:YbbR domain-containing protein